MLHSRGPGLETVAAASEASVRRRARRARHVSSQEAPRARGQSRWAGVGGVHRGPVTGGAMFSGTRGHRRAGRGEEPPSIPLGERGGWLSGAREVASGSPALVVAGRGRSAGGRRGARPSRWHLFCGERHRRWRDFMHVHGPPMVFGTVCCWAVSGAPIPQVSGCRSRERGGVCHLNQRET